MLIGIAVPALAAIVTYIDGWKKVAEAYKSFHSAVADASVITDLPRWVTLAILVALLAVIALTKLLPEWIERRRRKRLNAQREEAARLLAKAEKERFFRLDPQPPPENNDSPLTFNRADGEHKEILKWIRHTNRPVVYVTGRSGTGKSSLMSAYVVPALNRGTDAPADQQNEQVTAVMVRAFGDLDATLRDELGKPGVLWQKPPDLSDLKAREVLERVAKRLEDQKRRLVLVSDQFEEVMVGESHFPAMIADMYDPEEMDTKYPDSRAAHGRDDETLERIYIGRRFRNDTERLEKLFEMYTQMMTKGANGTPAKTMKAGAAGKRGKGVKP